MYYPHGGEQSYDYGFYLTDNGDGEDPDRSDVIEWSKRGSAIVGSKSAAVDTVHRVQLMVLEEGNRDYIEPIEVTDGGMVMEVRREQYKKALLPMLVT